MRYSEDDDDGLYYRVFGVIVVIILVIAAISYLTALALDYSAKTRFLIDIIHRLF